MGPILLKGIDIYKAKPNCIWSGTSTRRYIPVTRYQTRATRCRAAGTDVDVEHGIQSGKYRRRAAPRPSRAAAHNLREHNRGNACDTMSH